MPLLCGGPVEVLTEESGLNVMTVLRPPSLVRTTTEQGRVILGTAVAHIQRAVVSSMSHPVSAAPSADGCTTQDYMYTDRYHDCQPVQGVSCHPRISIALYSANVLEAGSHAPMHSGSHASTTSRNSTSLAERTLILSNGTTCAAALTEIARLAEAAAMLRFEVSLTICCCRAPLLSSCGGPPSTGTSVSPQPPRELPNYQNQKVLSAVVTGNRQRVLDLSPKSTMPQLNSGGGDDLGANDEMISFKDEGEQDEKIRESAFTEGDLADLKSSLVNESEINQNSNPAVVRRGQQDEQRVYAEKHREHLDEAPKHQDGGMYKAPSYSGYPFLMLPDPYLPNGPVSPPVSPLPFSSVTLSTTGSPGVRPSQTKTHLPEQRGSQ
ncbi:hypothetical protein NFI96_026168 [Prochilodus magdalenae]|nr:hypothetical protein NFI96_026168 [Prochilodus magdalenae]